MREGLTMKENTLNRPGNWEIDEGMAKEEAFIAEPHNEPRLDGAAMAFIFMTGAYFLSFKSVWNASIVFLFMIALASIGMASLWVLHNEFSDKSRDELHRMNKRNRNRDDDDDNRNIFTESIQTGDAYGYGIGH